MALQINSWLSVVEVVLSGRFRDDFLLTNAFSRVFVKIYENVSAGIFWTCWPSTLVTETLKAHPGNIHQNTCQSILMTRTGIVVMIFNHQLFSQIYNRQMQQTD